MFRSFQLFQIQAGDIYTLGVTWAVGGVPDTAITDVNIFVTDDATKLPPLWDDYSPGVPIDDYTSFEVLENATPDSQIPSLNFSTTKVGILVTLAGQTPYENSNFHFLGNGQQSLILSISNKLDYEQVPVYSVRMRASVITLFTTICMCVFLYVCVCMCR